MHESSFVPFLLLACLLYTMEKVLVLCNFALVIDQSLAPYDCVFLYCNIEEIIEIFDHSTKGIVCSESKAYSGVLNQHKKNTHFLMPHVDQNPDVNHSCL
jgi:hypothetical protein